MSSLSFALCGSNQLTACNLTLQSIRKFYPDSYIIIISDCGADYSELSKRYNTEYFYSGKKLSYPTQPFGWRKEGVLDFLQRLYIACSRCKTSHIMYTEEDVVVFKEIYVPDDAEIIGWPTCYGGGERFPNGFPDEFLKIIKDFSGVESDVNGYGAQGGSVINVSTFLENYAKITKFIEENLDFIQDNIYPTAGWIDCFLTWYYMLCGKKYTVRNSFRQVNNEFDIDTAPEDIEVVTHYQKLYNV